MIAVAGPTGSGKSELALQVADRFGGEIINCDSVQVFKYFNIGTAKLPWLPLARTADELATFRTIKGALDPDGVLNPHVLVPPGPA